MNVLSIDFDIIMAPVIEYYNNMVPHKDWDTIQEENPSMIIPKADLYHYTFIIQLIDKIISEVVAKIDKLCQDKEKDILSV